MSGDRGLGPNQRVIVYDATGVPVVVVHGPRGDNRYEVAVNEGGIMHVVAVRIDDLAALSRAIEREVNRCYSESR